jgi:hypothetical protein
LAGDLCTADLATELDDDNAAPSMDLMNRDCRARFFIFIRCIFITSSGRFHFGGVLLLSNSNMTERRPRSNSNYAQRVRTR